MKWINDSPTKLMRFQARLGLFLFVVGFIIVFIYGMLNAFLGETEWFIHVKEWIKVDGLSLLAPFGFLFLLMLFLRVLDPFLDPHGEREEKK